MFDTQRLGGETKRHRSRARAALAALESLATPTGMEALAVAAALAALAALVSTTTMETVVGLAVLVGLGCDTFETTLGGEQNGEHTYDR